MVDWSRDNSCFYIRTTLLYCTTYSAFSLVADVTKENHFARNVIIPCSSLVLILLFIFIWFQVFYWYLLSFRQLQVIILLLGIHVRVYLLYVSDPEHVTISYNIE
jgi:hypothetical protein